MLHTIESVNSVINDFIWGVPAMICIIGVGLYLSIRTGFLQIRKFGYAIQTTIGRDVYKRQPYVNRIDNMGYNGVGVAKEIQDIFEIHGLDCGILDVYKRQRLRSGIQLCSLMRNIFCRCIPT